MKKSNLFLILALTLPLVTSLAGIGMGTHQVLGSEENHSNKTMGMSKDLQTVIEQTKVINKSLRITANAVGIEIAVDPALADEARVKVEAADPADPIVELQEGGFSFQAREGAVDMRVTITLPASFDELTIETNAGRCQFKAETPFQVKRFQVNANAGSCTLELADLSTNDFEAIAAAGQLALEINTITFLDDKPGRLRLQNAAGKMTATIGGLVPYSLSTKVGMGKLRLDRDGKTENIMGVNSHADDAASEGSPRVELEAMMGMMDVTLRKGP